MSGLIHLYVGDGKGKSTASIGLAVRAAGWNEKVVFASFLKTQKTGELVSLEKLGVKVIRSERKMGFVFQLSDEEKLVCASEQRAILEKVSAEVDAGAGLVILDEAADAVNTGMLSAETLKTWLESKPEELEVVITGRDPEKWLIDIADYMTEFKKVKHPFDEGVAARKKIEF